MSATGHYWLVPLAVWAAATTNTWETRRAVGSCSVIVTASMSVSAHNKRNEPSGNNTERTFLAMSDTRERPKVFSSKLPETKREAKSLELTTSNTWPERRPRVYVYNTDQTSTSSSTSRLMAAGKHSRFRLLSCPFSVQKKKKKKNPFNELKLKIFVLLDDDSSNV